MEHVSAAVRVRGLELSFVDNPLFCFVLFYLPGKTETHRGTLFTLSTERETHTNYISAE